jgi:predicted flavoprotein YhiN
LKVTGHCSFGEAIITAGGIYTNEINSRTMESKIVKGLYFAGEIIDIDADTGGFNLQAAFSTGWLAGRAIKLD